MFSWQNSSQLSASISKLQEHAKELMQAAKQRNAAKEEAALSLFLAALENLKTAARDLPIKLQDPKFTQEIKTEYMAAIAQGLQSALQNPALPEACYKGPEANKFNQPFSQFIESLRKFNMMKEIVGNADLQEYNKLAIDGLSKIQTTSLPTVSPHHKTDKL